jgi:hypothetical protein
MISFASIYNQALATFIAKVKQDRYVITAILYGSLSNGISIHAFLTRSASSSRWWKATCRAPCGTQNQVTVDEAAYYYDGEKGQPT